MMNGRRQGYRFGPFSVDLEQRVLMREGQPVPLRPKDFDMLLVLVESHGRIVEKDELMKQVWPDTFVEEANLSHHVFTIRKALGDDKEEPRYIATIPRRGYRFVAPVAVLSNTPDPLQPRADPPSSISAKTEPASTSINVASERPTRVSRWQRLAVPTALLVTGAVAAYGAFGITRVPRPPVRLTIPLNPGDAFTEGPAAPLAVSPDGRRVAYTANGRLYIRLLDRLEATPLPGIDRAGLASARTPFFSPDGRWIGFWELRQMKKVSVDGGPPLPLCDLTPPPYGASWSTDGTILLGHGSRGIWRVAGQGGSCERVIEVAEGERAHGPQLLPDGHNVLFTLARTPNWEEAEIVVHSLNSGERRSLFRGMDARYLATGHLVYGLEETLLAVRFDAASLSVIGTPVTLVERVRRLGPFHPAVQFAATPTDTLAYLEPRNVPAARRTLVWVDRQGREEAVGAEPRPYAHPRLSPDGTRLALEIHDRSRDVWVWEFSRRTLTPITTHPAADAEPVWMTDGKHLVFLSQRTGLGNLFWQAADGDGTAERLTDGSRIRGADAVTPDGTALVIRESDGAGTSDLGLLLLADARGPTLASAGTRQVVSSSYAELNAEVSPDGQWLAYESNISGRVEVWLRPFAGPSPTQSQVSAVGGSEPLWGPDSTELFYRDADGAVMRVAIVRGSPRGQPEQLFPGPLYALGGRGDFATLRRRTYDVSKDGRRFLMIKTPDVAAARPVPDRIVVVQNWLEELKQQLRPR